MHDDKLLAHITAHLLKQPEATSTAQLLEPDWLPDIPFNDPPVPAAVLIALVARPTGRTVLYTQRSLGLRSHSGQVAFPGGKIDANDIDAGAAALREAEEEIGLDPNTTKILGFMPLYLTGTNYLITPVVASVAPAGEFVANPKEVDEVFEVPLDFIAGEDNYSRFSIQHAGHRHRTWQLDHGGHMIWGITANLTRQFRDLTLVDMA